MTRITVFSQRDLVFLCKATTLEVLTIYGTIPVVYRRDGVRMTAFAFEWNEAKALQNSTKHGVDFEEASTVLSDTNSITIYDEIHSIDEDRYIDIGHSITNRLLVVVYTERGDHIRIISARQATSAERRLYEQ